LPRSRTTWTRIEWVSVSPVVKEAAKSAVASISPRTMRTDWARRRGTLRRAMRRATRFRTATKTVTAVAIANSAASATSRSPMGMPKSFCICPSREGEARLI